MVSKKWLLLVLFSMVGCIPDEIAVFCKDDTECVDGDRQGVCLFDGSTGPYCAFADATCATGLRWWGFAFIEDRDNCVNPLVFRDGGTCDGGTQ